MCTAIRYKQFFGRNLDLEYGYPEVVAVTPRGYPLEFRGAPPQKRHHAMIGIATVDRGFPLYYEAVNEKGLGMAGLDFPDNAYYPPPSEKPSVGPFEVIPWVLGQCGTAAEAVEKIKDIAVSDIRYSDDFPQPTLHWMIADRNDCFVLEPTKDGLRLYENPVGVLTNNPPYPYQLFHLAGFQHLSAGQQNKHFEGLELACYGGGMGALGLPGDFSSPSRFVKAAFVTKHSRSGPTEESNVTQFFHLLDSVAMPRGAVRVRDEQNAVTRYSCCCNLLTGVYYFTTYENRRIQAVDLKAVDLYGTAVVSFSLDKSQDFRFLTSGHSGNDPL